MTNDDLQNLVEKLSNDFFGRPFLHRAFFNKRLRTTGGRYQLATHDIEINPKMLTEHGKQTLVGVIKHELCHYHLHLVHAGYRHCDNDFKRLLQEVGGSRYAPRSKQAVRQKRKYLYQCVSCGQTYPRVRRVNTDRYVCSRCHGHLQLVANGAWIGDKEVLR
ncbi:SprT family protein [Ligilactobacillus acidipiscis]|uniref:SprT family protein n=1 Tax=Ligilactobacillus acidipiscis TaxID=89059 RepID=UPI003866764E